MKLSPLSNRFNQIRRFSHGFDFDVIVIGGGHAGCEGAAAAARTGAKTLLLTHNASTIGEMSCNPSFGGIGKGHLLREIDALDGVCSRICDKSAITYQALNRGQGPAVLGLRAQIDRSIYKREMQKEMNNTRNLEIMEGSVEELILRNHNDDICVDGVVLSDDKKIRSKTVLITTGTFLGGEIFLGPERWKAGRIGEQSAQGLSKAFKGIGFRLGRLRTGTPPRIFRNTIDFSQFELMPPDTVSIPFSFMTKEVWLSPADQLPTYLGETNETVRKVVLRNLHENEHVASETSGPRYCPSLESKVIRFPELKHRTFLEHEGLDSNLIYPQGMSMTFKPEVQLEIMRCIKGLEKVEIAQPGYGVQYDFVDPKQLKPTLETKKVKGLFLAGQINGTTGYEEAAAQGILAGINAGLLSKEEEALIIKRTEAYIGVLVDDLTSLGTNEPYRMFTSRAECRLHLRPDNADLRLTPAGRKHGVVSDQRWSVFSEQKNGMDTATSLLTDVKMSIAKWSRLLPQLKSRNASKVLNGYELIYRHNISIEELKTALPDQLAVLTGDLKALTARLSNEGSYSLDHKRMQDKIAEINRESELGVPEDIDFSRIKGLSMECIEKLDRARPLNLAAASRIPGVTPEAIVVLLRFLKKTA
ncbi:unnamed protein product [Auanema sp. JU1783]|nr:unnamed protein product [Auanema sp. JU1783]